MRVGALLDATVLIDVLRGRQGVAARLRALRSNGDRPFACVINVEEFERGIRGSRETAAARLLCDGLELAPLGRDQGQQAGAWRRAYAVQGVTLSRSDCLIAAAAAAIGGRLATGNPGDFPMPELDVEHWPVGE